MRVQLNEREPAELRLARLNFLDAGQAFHIVAIIIAITDLHLEKQKDGEVFLFRRSVDDFAHIPNRVIDGPRAQALDFRTKVANSTVSPYLLKRQESVQ